jgi:hypothetical protein
MRVLGYFILCCAAVLLLSVIGEKRNAEVEIPHLAEMPHVAESPHVRVEVRPVVSGGPSKDVKQWLMRDQDWVELCARDNPYRPGFTKEMLEACDKRGKPNRIDIQVDPSGRANDGVRAQH